MVDVTQSEESTALTNWEERMEREARAAAAVERPSVSYISLRSGIMSYMDTPLPGNKLQCVVLGSAIEQSWYDTDYDANNITPPSCFALCKPGDEEFMAPHDAVPEAQRQSETCVTCEKFKWGSGKGKGKACGTRRRLALIPADALKDPDTLKSADMAIMKISVTNVKNWSAYVNRISGLYQRPTWGLVTEISVRPDPKTQFRISFDPIGTIGMDLLPKLANHLEVAESVLMAPFDMTPPSEDEEDTRSKGRRKY